MMEREATIVLEITYPEVQPDGSVIMKVITIGGGDG